jgi:hypothetical protein
MVIIHFRDATRPSDDPRVIASELRIGLDGPKEISLHLWGGAPGSPMPLTLIEICRSMDAGGRRHRHLDHTEVAMNRHQTLDDHGCTGGLE